MGGQSISDPGPGSVRALRESNRRRLVEVLEAAGVLTQAQLARQSGLAPATVSNIVRELAAEGRLDIAGVEGNRRRAIRLVQPAGVAVGIDVGHRHLRVLVAGRDHEVVAEKSEPLDFDHRAEDCLAMAGRLIDEALTERGVSRDDVIGVGLGLPAPIDSITHEVGAPSILPGWVGLPAARVASEHLGLPVEVDNDANLGVLAERTWGAGRGYTDFVFLKLSDGVGAGLVVNGELFRGRAGTAGEIGHTTMDEFGTVCRCGNRGCLETIVAARSVLRLLEPVRGTDLTIAGVVELAEQGDPACRRVLSDTGRQVGIAAANFCNVFNPQRILVGGELALAGEFLLAPMRDMVQRYGIPSASSTVEVVLAELGARAPALGAVALALESAWAHPLDQLSPVAQSS